jgi:hypothetical protein
MRRSGEFCQFGDELVILAVELVVLAMSGWGKPLATNWSLELKCRRIAVSATRLADLSLATT